MGVYRLRKVELKGEAYLAGIGVSQRVEAYLVTGKRERITGRGSGCISLVRA